MHRKRALFIAQLLVSALPCAPAAAHATVLTVTDQSYDELGRVKCVALRMNDDAFGSSPVDACTLTTEDTAIGPDRITRNLYDDAGQLLTVQRAYGTALQQNYATYTYTPNGKRASVVDANDNRSVYVYDGLDRLCRLYFPSATLGANQANTGGVVESALTCASGGTNPDYEGYGYDANNNRTSLRLRSGESIGYTYDALNRETLKDIPGGTSEDVYSAYDSMGHRLYAHFASAGGSGIDDAYDSIGRLTSETSYGQALSFQYDPASNRTRVTWPDALYVQYTYDAANRMLNVEENSATSGAGLLAVYAYDEIGRRHTITRGNGAVTTYGYDGVSRLTSLGQNLTGTADDQTLSFGYLPSSQIASRGATNIAYHWAAPAVNASYTPNGLNQYTAVGGATFSYSGGDGARGNLTSDGSRSFDYDLENHLISVSGSASLTLAYDPLGRLHQTTASSTTTTFLYDGDRLIGEYNGSTLTERYMHGAGVDEPLVWYHGNGTTDRRYLITDNQGSIIAESGAAAMRYTYGPYGEPDSWAGARFRYTGQIALPEAHLYHYKARVYDPLLGRFLQTDPVGYQDNWNLYAYVADDPLNHSDATGLQADVEVLGYDMGFNPFKMKPYGHTYLRMTNPDTGQQVILYGGQHGYSNIMALSDAPTGDDVHLTARLDDSRDSFQQAYVDQNDITPTLVDRQHIDTDFGEAVDQLANVAHDVNAAQIDYTGQSHNSNAVTNVGFEAVTGRSIQADDPERYPGIELGLTKPPKDLEGR